MHASNPVVDRMKRVRIDKLERKRNMNRLCYKVDLNSTLYFRICIFAGFILPLFAVFGQDSDLSELKHQIRQLMQENQELRDRLDRQSGHLSEMQQRLSTLESTASDAASYAVAVPFQSEPELGSGLRIPKARIHGFADLSYRVQDVGGMSSSTFALGDLDLFMTSELSDNVSFLLEADFAGNTEDNSAKLTLQRVVLRYAITDALNIKIGRTHTPLGYWNQNFHHGFWLHTPATRPEIYKFERDGGALPVHAFGLSLLGEIHTGIGVLGYDFGMYNGRGDVRTEVQHGQDKNDHKALNLLLFASPAALPGVQLGFDVYWDKIPGNPDASLPGGGPRASGIDELIIGGFLVYEGENLELAAEVFGIEHEDHTSGKKFETLGLYIQAGYTIDKLTPYYRYDYVDYGDGDPFFADIDVDSRKHTVGVRWDVFTWNALKLEYGYNDRQQAGDVQSLILNSSFAF